MYTSGLSSHTQIFCDEKPRAEVSSKYSFSKGCLDFFKMCFVFLPCSLCQLCSVHRHFLHELRSGGCFLPDPTPDLFLDFWLHGKDFQSTLILLHWKKILFPISAVEKQQTARGTL